MGWASNTAPWPHDLLNRLASSLPPCHAAGALRFHRWQDRQARILGRLLLRAVLRRAGQPCDLTRMVWSLEGRPSLPECGDFNLSHSGGLVLCGWIARGRIGVDVETDHPGLRLADLEPSMSLAERQLIKAAAAPMQEAVRLWTAKEAVCKADGCGITVAPLPDCSNNVVRFRGRSWAVRSFWIERYWCALAVESEGGKSREGTLHMRRKH